MTLTLIHNGSKPAEATLKLVSPAKTTKFLSRLCSSLILLGACVMIHLIFAIPVTAQGVPAQTWHLDGNRRTDPNTDFIGTSDAANLVIRTSNVPRLIVDANGRFRILFNATIGDSLDVAGLTRLNNTTASTSATSGALVVAGGTGIGKSLNVGIDANIGQDGNISRDLNVGRNANVTGLTRLNNTTASNSPTTGALVVAGGVGVGGKLNVASDLNVDGKTRFAGDLDVNGNAAIGGTLHITGDTTSTGNITTPTMTVNVLTILGGSDLAEPFKVSQTYKAIPGMVVSIDPARVGELRISDRPYDRMVAGIISGANGIRPGVTMQQSGTVAEGQFPIALSGRVWVYADASSNGPIGAGDLLTTSAVPGHAMKVTDFARSQGAVLGKAMSSLEKGRGLVLVLVVAQ